MRLLTCIFTYNRYALLRNTVESFFAYGPGGDLLILDDGSSDSRVHEYLDQMESRCTVLRPGRAQDQWHGGLYRNMTKATEWALEHEYSHIFYLQDDVQFLWKDDQFLERVENVFASCPDAAMVSCFFHKGIIARQMRTRLIPHSSGCGWHLSPYAIINIGIMSLRLFKEHSWTFGERESKNSDFWKEKGYKLYALRDPVLAFVPWPEVWNDGKKHGSVHQTSAPFFLKPLSLKDVIRLKKSPLNDIPWHEDYCVPWGWKCLAPFWFTRRSKEYRKLLWQWIKNEKRLPWFAGERF